MNTLFQAVQPVQDPAESPGVLTPVQFFRPTPIPENQFSTATFMAATLALASAATVGSNMVDVRNGAMTGSQAVANGLAKGTAATLILSVLPKQSVLDIALNAAALAGAGYAIDAIMKKGRQARPEKTEPDEP